MNRKKMVLWVGLIFLGIHVFAQDRSIRFEEVSFQKALEMAKKSDKLLFVDCYTSWCGPCKMLAKDVFTDNDVADYFNANFVSLSIDCEKGEGPEIRKRFDVAAYPTLLFIDGEGKVVHKMLGASTPEMFLESVKKGLDPNTSLYGKEKRYQAGERDKDFMLDLIASYKAVLNTKKAIELSRELLAATDKDDVLSKEMWDVVSYYYISPCGSEWWDFILEHSDEYEALVGRDAVVRKIGSTMHPFLFGFACGDQAKDKSVFQNYKALVDKYQPTEKETLYAFIRLGESANSGKFNRYFKTVCKEMQTLPIAEHYRFFYNALGYLTEHATAKQKEQLLRLVQESQAKNNETMKPAYEKLIKQLTD